MVLFVCLFVCLSVCLSSLRLNYGVEDECSARLYFLW